MSRVHDKDTPKIRTKDLLEIKLKKKKDLSVKGQDHPPTSYPS